MTAPRKLALYSLLLAAVLGVSMAIGSAVEPIGLANAVPEGSEHDTTMSDGSDERGETAGLVPGLAAADRGYRLVPDTDTVAANDATTYRFRVEGEAGAVTEFDVEHTKRMHLIVVRRDFAGFQHLHPTMAGDGTWATDLTVTEPGAYRVFADFVVGGEKETLATDLFVPGDFRPQPLPAPGDEADAGAGYTVELTGEPAAGGVSTLEFVVRLDGEVVDNVAEYLGARGHLVALRDGDLAYLHVHADEERLSFETEFPTAGEYRLFLQFRHAGDVRTAAFTVDAGEEAR